MISRSNRSRIPYRLAAIAALALVLGSFALPEQPETNDPQEARAQADTNSSVDNTVTELVGVAVAAAKPFTFSISSLIFRF